MYGAWFSSVQCRSCTKRPYHPGYKARSLDSKKNLQQNNNIWYHSLLCLMSAYGINVKSLWSTWKHFMKYLPKPLRSYLVGSMPLKKKHAVVKAGTCSTCWELWHAILCNRFLPHLFTLVYQKSTSKIYLTGQFTWTIWLSNTLRHHNGESFFCEVFGFDLSQKEWVWCTNARR